MRSKRDIQMKFVGQIQDLKSSLTKASLCVLPKARSLSHHDHNERNEKCNALVFERKQQQEDESET